MRALSRHIKFARDRWTIIKRVGDSGMSATKIILAIVGAALGLAAMAMLFGGAALAIAYGTQRDDDGFLTSRSYDLGSDGYALISEDVDIAPHAGDWWPSDLASVRLQVESADGGPLFVGIGPTDDVDDYLRGVALDRLVEIRGRGDDDIDYDSQSGGAPGSAPGAQTFWAVSSEGAGERSITWEVESGTWTVVVMNADASLGVDVQARAGAKADILLPIGIGLLFIGLVAGGVAAVLLVIATRPTAMAPVAAGAPGPATAAPGMPLAAAIATAGAGGAVPTVYPVALEGRLDEPLSRWMWLVKWILAIPHFIILWFLWVAFGILTVVAFFAILINGRYPRGIFDFNVGVMRWTWRVGFYAFSAMGTDKYPPFTLEDVESYPARLSVAYPERLSRGLVLVKWWLLAIPHYIIVGILTNGITWWSSSFNDENTVFQFGGGLIGLLALIGVIALAFTGKYPKDLFNLVIGLNRWVYRVTAYAALMRDEYPPFRLDNGEGEPEKTGS
jgi:hypothetical protein